MADSALVTFILNQPGMVHRLLTEHVDDGRGRCQACPLGGQRGYHAWPCTIHAAAIQASEVGRPPRPAPAAPHLTMQDQRTQPGRSTTGEIPVGEEGG